MNLLTLLGTHHVCWNQNIQCQLKNVLMLYTKLNGIDFLI